MSKSETALNGLEISKEKWNLSALCRRRPQDFRFDQFTSLFQRQPKELSYIKKHLLGVMDVQSVQIYGYLYIFGDTLLSLWRPPSCISQSRRYWVRG